MPAIYKRELNSSLNTLNGHIFCVFVLLFAGIYCSTLNIKSGYSHFEYVLNYMVFIYIIAIPILTMRTLSEEYRHGTIRLLYSLPVSSLQIVAGKFLALCTVMLIPAFVLSLYPLILTRYGAVPLLNAYGALAAFCFLGAALSAIGLFISSLTENSSTAACISFAVFLFLYYSNSLSAFTASPLLKTALEHIGVFECFYVFVDGIFDISGIVYLLSIISASLFFTLQVLEKRRRG